MKRLLAGLVVAALVSAGCQNKGSPGGRGAEHVSSAGGMRRAVSGQPSETFTVKAPNTTTTVKQGETKSVDLSVNRSKDLKRDITLSITPEAKSGLTVDPASHTIKASDE